MLLGIISDAHGNLSAMTRCIEQLKLAGATELFFLGDSVGYIPSLSVIKYLYTHKKIRCILGNHEQMLIDFIYDDKIKNDDIYQMSFFKKKITKDLIVFIKEWSEKIEEKYPCGNVLFVHGSPTDFTYGYVYPDTNLEEYSSTAYDYIFMGNTHRPFIKKKFNKVFVNVGSCGMPRDVGNIGSCALLDTENGQVDLLRIDITDLNAEVKSKYQLHDSVGRLFERR